MNVLEIHNIGKTYQMGDIEVPVLKNISLGVKEGEMLAIMGPSGSGKSTLMHILGLLDAPDSGSYRLFGEEVSKLSADQLAALRSEKIGFIFQQFHLLSRTTALENVGLPGIYSGKKYSEKHAIELLEMVGLGNRVHHNPNELSGGQQQRVAIARSLINNPKIILADEPTGNLDSAGKAEIMEILGNLNRSGITVIIVTHEPEVAFFCDRIIHIADGEIEKITKNKKKKTSSNAQIEKDNVQVNFNPKNLNANDHENANHRAGSVTLEYSRQALKTLLANKVRTSLSMLGILIGVAAVVTVLAIGEGARKSIEQQLSSMGSNLLVLRPGSNRMGAVSLEAGSVTRFTLEDKKAIMEIPQVSRTSSTVNGRAQAVFENKNWNTSVVGADEEYAPIHNAKPESGRFFTTVENKQRARVAVIGTTVMRELFGEQNPVGEFIKLNKINFQVIGILPPKGANAYRDQDDVIVIPVQTLMKRLMHRDYIDNIEIEVRSAPEMETVDAKVRELVVSRHRLTPAQTDSFQIRNMADIQDAVNQTNKTMSMLLISIAAISLLVGGIGIMNIMLVSVKERTREIGLRKAIGARSRDILMQFLIESLLIGVIGGIAGLILGYGIILVMIQVSGWSAEITINSVILAIFFSSFIGTIFGLWPARQAANLNPITALRYE
jgi:macrolide transport system ATP-binding/permease protein